MKILTLLILILILCLNNCSSETNNAPEKTQTKASIASDLEARIIKLISSLASPGRWPWIWRNGGPKTVYPEDFADLLINANPNHIRIYNSLGSESEKAFLVCAIVDLEISGCEQIIKDYLNLDSIHVTDVSDLPPWHQYGLEAATTFWRKWSEGMLPKK